MQNGTICVIFIIFTKNIINKTMKIKKNILILKQLAKEFE